MKLNKAENVAKITTMVAGKIQNCTKLEIQNLVFPKWSELGIFGETIRQVVVTKEQKDGCLYEEAVYQVVLRILDGKLYLNGNLDTYCWKHSKLESAKDVKEIGNTSLKSRFNKRKLLKTISSLEERIKIENLFKTLRTQFFLVTLPEEERNFVRITEDLYNAGLTHVVDEWMEIDTEGLADATELNVGDCLIVTKDGFYCIREEEFNITHRI